MIQRKVQAGQAEDIKDLKDYLRLSGTAGVGEKLCSIGAPDIVVLFLF